MYSTVVVDLLRLNMDVVTRDSTRFAGAASVVLVGISQLVITRDGHLIAKGPGISMEKIDVDA
jgi:hypothetical protein